MANLQHYFESRQVEMTDNSILFEVINPDSERVASCTNAEASEDLAMTLNMALTDWLEGDEADREVNCI